MIYFIRFGSKRIVKIGHSREHPRIRMMHMQTGTPERLYLLGMAPGGPDEEADWHRRFAHLRVTGEWFRWTPELRDAAKPHLHDPFGRKARQVALENGLAPYPRWGSKAARNRQNAMRCRGADVPIANRPQQSATETQGSMTGPCPYGGQ